MASSRVIVVGFVQHRYDRARQPAAACPGETVLGGDLTTAAGGKGAKPGCGRRPAGRPRWTLVARLGGDMFGQQTLTAFRREGLDLTYLQQGRRHAPRAWR